MKDFMKTKLALIVALAAFTVTATAADATLSYTPDQLKSVQRVVARMNAEAVAKAVAENPDVDVSTVPQMTEMQYFQTLFTAKLNAIVAQEKRLIQAELLEKYEAADDTTKTSVETALEVTP